MSGKKSSLKLIIIIFLIAIINGLFWNSEIFGSSLLESEIHYGKAAANILENHNFCHDFEYPCVESQPLYPLFLAGVFFVFGHNWDIVRFIQIILFALTAMLVFLLAKELFNQKVAAYSGLLVALFYPLAGYTGKLCREVFFTFLAVLLIYCLSKAYLSQKKKWFVFSGISLGLLMLTNAVTYFLPLLVIGNFLIIYKKDFFSKKVLMFFFFFLFSLIIVFGPWLIRSYYSDIKLADIKGRDVLLGRAYLIDDLQVEYKEHFIGNTLGYFFARKFNPQLNNRRLTTFPPQSVYQRINELDFAGYSQKEINQIMHEEALFKIFEKPHIYGLNSFLYFLSFNNPMLFNPETFIIYRIHNLFVDTHPELTDLTKTIIILAIRLIWLIFFFFVIYGGIKMAKNWPKFSWLLLTILYFNIIYSLLFAIPRYALPIYSFYIILFVYGVLLSTERPYWSLNFQLPLRFLFSQDPKKSKSGRIHTKH